MSKPTKKVVIGLIALGLVVASASLAWWFIHQPTVSTITPPPAVHAYDGETNLKYELRRGSFVQTDETKSLTVSSNKIELKLTLDKDYISPAIGSSVKGTIQLLVNGRAASQWPAGFDPNEWESTNQNPRVYLTTYGAYSWVCPSSDLLYSDSNRTDGDDNYRKNYVEYCYPGLDYTNITRHNRPYVSSVIYSSQASNSGYD